MMDKVFIALSWVGRWLLYALLMALAGAILFGIGYPLFGSLIGMDLTIKQMILNGMRNGAFLIGGVWGPGASFIICMIQAHKRRQRRRQTNPAEPNIL